MAEGTTPAFVTDDLKSTIAWYVDNLGFEATRLPGRNALVHGAGVQILLQEHDEFKRGYHYELRGEGLLDAYFEVPEAALQALRIRLGNRKALREYRIGGALDSVRFVVVDCNGYAIGLGPNDLRDGKGFERRDQAQRPK